MNKIETRESKMALSSHQYSYSNQRWNRYRLPASPVRSAGRQKPGPVPSLIQTTFRMIFLANIALSTVSDLLSDNQRQKQNDLREKINMLIHK